MRHRSSDPRRSAPPHQTFRRNGRSCLTVDQGRSTDRTGSKSGTEASRQTDSSPTVHRPASFGKKLGVAARDADPQHQMCTDRKHHCHRHRDQVGLGGDRMRRLWTLTPDAWRGLPIMDWRRAWRSGSFLRAVRSAGACSGPFRTRAAPAPTPRSGLDAHRAPPEPVGRRCSRASWPAAVAAVKWQPAGR